MASVPPGEWVPHVEAYVDVSRPAAQHSASVDALATLVNKDRLTLFDLVAKMDMYLTTTDHILRSRGILLLGELLSRISDKWLDVNTITTLSDFFISRLGGEQLYWICEAIDEEKDPECLKLSFHVVEVVMKLFPDPSGLAAQFASEFFEILSKYFPVYFTHGVADDLNATRDDLSKALMILLVIVDSLAKLSVSLQDKDLVYSLLLVLSGMLMDEKGKECILDNIHITISVLTQLVSYPHMMVVRETALQCLVAFSTFPHSKVFPMRRKV
nr:unnamed protein product [Digitaria exilis]